MASDEYHEAMLARVREIQRHIRDLPQRDALSLAYALSREMPEEAVRMLVAELLMEYWRLTHGPFERKGHQAELTSR